MSVTDARMSVTTVLTSRVRAPVSLVGAPLRETHASFTLVMQVVRVIRAAKGVEGTPSSTMDMPIEEIDIVIPTRLRQTILLPAFARYATPAQPPRTSPRGRKTGPARKPTRRPRS
ncbi:MAG: hypothetical protein ACLP1X_28360 [Polyangiaceae bacterium]|jgi:hypothetical protein